VIIISPLLGEEVVNVVLNLAARGYEIICFTPSTERALGTLTTSKSLAKRILASERRIKMAQVSGIARLIEFSPRLDIRRELRRWKAW